jgi:hypothetical protein
MTEIRAALVADTTSSSSSSSNISNEKPLSNEGYYSTQQLSLICLRAR